MCSRGTALLLRLELTDSQEFVIACQKSAEGIVDGRRPVRVLRHSSPNLGSACEKREQQINRTVVPSKARTVPGDKSGKWSGK